MFGRVLNIPGFLYAMVTQGSECGTYNHGHKIMKHFRILVWFDSSQVKWYMKSSTKNLYIVYELPHRFPNYLGLRTIGNQTIMEKLQN